MDFSQVPPSLQISGDAQGTYSRCVCNSHIVYCKIVEFIGLSGMSGDIPCLQGPSFPCAGALGHGLVPVQIPRTHCLDVFQEQLFPGWQLSEQGLPVQCPLSLGCGSALGAHVCCLGWWYEHSSRAPVPAATASCPCCYSCLDDYLHAWKHFLKFYPLISAPLWAALVQLILVRVHECSLPDSGVPRLLFSVHLIVYSS